MIRLALLFALATGVAVGAEPTDQKPETADGTWIITAMEVGGMKVPDEAVKQMGAKLTLTGNKWSLKMGDNTSAGTSKIDLTKKPKEIDITTTEGKNKGTVIKAIVEHKGDTMKACYDVSGKERPKEFATKDQPTYMLIGYKREKK